MKVQLQNSQKYIVKDQGIGILFKHLKVIVPFYMNIPTLYLNLQLKENDGQQFIVSHSQLTLQANQPQQTSENHGLYVYNFIPSIPSLKQPLFYMLLKSFKQPLRINEVQLDGVQLKFALSITMQENSLPIIEETELLVQQRRICRIHEDLCQINVEFMVELQPELIDWKGNIYFQTRNNSLQNDSKFFTTKRFSQQTTNTTLSEEFMNKGGIKMHLNSIDKKIKQQFATSPIKLEETNKDEKLLQSKGIISVIDGVQRTYQKAFIEKVKSMPAVLKLDEKVLERIREERDTVKFDHFSLKQDRLHRIIKQCAHEQSNKRVKGFIQYNPRYPMINAIEKYVKFKPQNRLKEKLGMITEQSGRVKVRQRVANLIELKKSEIENSKLKNLAKEKESFIQRLLGNSVTKRRTINQRESIKANPLLSLFNKLSSTDDTFTKSMDHSEDNIGSTQQVQRKEDFQEKYQRHVQFNYFCQVPRYKTLADAQIMLRDVYKDLKALKRKGNFKVVQNFDDPTDVFEVVKRQNRSNHKIMALNEEDERLFLRQLESKDIDNSSLQQLKY